MKGLKIIILLLLPQLIFAQTGFVNNGVRMVIGEGTKLEISGTENANYMNNTLNSQNGRIELYGTMLVGGNWENNSNTQNVFTQFGPNGEIIFNGTADQTIGGTTSTNFPELSVDGYVILNQDFQISDNLNLNNGALDIGDYNLIIDNLGNLTSTSGFSENAMIIADGNGQVLLTVPSTGEYFIPVGTNNGTLIFSPINLNFLSGTFNNSQLAINVYNQKHPLNESSADFLNRYWTIENTGISNFLCKSEFTFDNSDIVGNENYIYGGILNNNYWQLLNRVENNSIIDTLTYFSDVTGIHYNPNEIVEYDNLDVNLSFQNNTLYVNSNLMLVDINFDIYNSIGQCIKNGKLNNSSFNVINLNVATGIYIIKLSSENLNYSKSFYLQ